MKDLTKKPLTWKDWTKAAVAIALFLVAIAFVFFYEPKNEVDDTPPPVRPVKSMIVGPAPRVPSVHCPGVVDARAGVDLSFEVSGRNLVFEDVVFQYVMKVLERDLEHLERCGVDAFEVLGMEKECFWDYDGFKFKGYIDRLDRVLPGEVRVVDYKTGKVEDDDIDVFDSTAGKVVAKLFGTDNSKRPKIALQIFLYDMFVEADVPEGSILTNSVYAPSRLFVSEVRDVPASGLFTAMMKERLSELLQEIADTSVPFTHTSDTATCSMCDFKNICGR